MSVNKVILVGNLGKKPELRYTPGGQAVANFTLATNERFGGKDGQEAKERTEWHRIVVWGRTAENCGQYLDKGIRHPLRGAYREITKAKTPAPFYFGSIIGVSFSCYGFLQLFFLPFLCFLKSGRF